MQQGCAQALAAPVGGTICLVPSGMHVIVERQFNACLLLQVVQQN